MKRALITQLRNKNASLEEYRRATDQLGTVLAVESDALLPKTTIFVETPLSKTHGVAPKHEVMLVPILRSGLVLLPPFLRFHPTAKIGFIGARRDEKTAIAELYYCNLPDFNQDTPILLLDPMIATGGSASLAVDVLKQKGASEKQIILISFIAAPEGIDYFQNKHPEVTLMVAQIDQMLDDNKFILPGLGDFGDRYFGTDTG